VALKFYGIPLVWIHLSNRITDEDMKLRREFSAWMTENHIFPVQAGSGGPERRGDGYSPADARKIIQWLTDHGAELDPPAFKS
jgi:hypothetical protein